MSKLPAAISRAAACFWVLSSCLWQYCQSIASNSYCLVPYRVLTAGPLTDPKRTVFSLVSGSHTHYLAAETPREAELWVSIIWETWLHCFSHTARGTGTMHSSGVVISQKLLAENTRLWENIKELDSKVSQADYEYWRYCYGLESAKNDLQSCDYFGLRCR